MFIFLQNHYRRVQRSIPAWQRMVHCNSHNSRVSPNHNGRRCWRCANWTPCMLQPYHPISSGTLSSATNSRRSSASISRCRGAPTLPSMVDAMWRPASRSTISSSSWRADASIIVCESARPSTTTPQTLTMTTTTTVSLWPPLRYAISKYDFPTTTKISIDPMCLRASPVTMKVPRRFWLIQMDLVGHFSRIWILTSPCWEWVRGRLVMGRICLIPQWIWVSNWMRMLFRRGTPSWKLCWSTSACCSIWTRVAGSCRCTTTSCNRMRSRWSSRRRRASVRLVRMTALGGVPATWANAIASMAFKALTAPKVSAVYNGPKVQ